jgi:hypothetical protein
MLSRLEVGVVATFLQVVLQVHLVDLEVEVDEVLMQVDQGRQGRQDRDMMERPRLLLVAQLVEVEAVQLL